MCQELYQTKNIDNKVSLSEQLWTKKETITNMTSESESYYMLY